MVVINQELIGCKSFFLSFSPQIVVLNIEKVVLILSTMVDRQSNSEVNSSISINYRPILRVISRISDLGIFATNCWMTTIYYRLLGARIGRDVHIDERMRLYECDLLTLQDGCRLDTQTLRGFCVERDGYFRLAPVTIGTEAVVNPYTDISPGAKIADGAVYGPHASSYENPSEKSFASYNRTFLSDPSWPLRILIAWPIILIVTFISCKYMLFYSCHLLISLFRYSVDFHYLHNVRPLVAVQTRHRQHRGSYPLVLLASSAQVLYIFCNCSRSTSTAHSTGAGDYGKTTLGT